MSLLEIAKNMYGNTNISVFIGLIIVFISLFTIRRKNNNTEVKNNVQVNEYDNLVKAREAKKAKDTAKRASSVARAKTRNAKIEAEQLEAKRIETENNAIERSIREAEIEKAVKANSENFRLYRESMKDYVPCGDCYGWQYSNNGRNLYYRFVYCGRCDIIKNGTPEYTYGY
jgi:hypothetical protein